MDQDINIFPEKGGDTSLRITILDEKKTDRQVMQTLVLLIPHSSSIKNKIFVGEYSVNEAEHLFKN